VTGYDASPGLSVARTDSSHELQDVIDDFQKLTQKRIAGNRHCLKEEENGFHHCLAEENWQKKNAESSLVNGAGMRQMKNRVREID